MGVSSTKKADTFRVTTKETNKVDDGALDNALYIFFPHPTGPC